MLALGPLRTRAGPCQIVARPGLRAQREADRDQPGPGPWLRGHDRTRRGGAHRLTSSRATWRHASRPVSGIGRPKLWAYTSSRGTAVASTS